MRTQERLEAVTAAHVDAERRAKPVPVNDALRNATYHAQGDRFVNCHGEALELAEACRGVFGDWGKM